MEVQVFREIQWREYGQTVLHPVSLVVLAVMVAVLLFSDTRYLLIPLVLVSVLLTSMQRVIIASFDFTMLRLILLFGVARLILRNDGRLSAWNATDKIFVTYIIISSVTYVALWRSSAAVANRLGFAYEGLLTFFIIRAYLRSKEQIVLLLRALSVAFVAIATFMIIEQTTGYNFFSVLGGVAERTAEREGRLRAQGTFSHPIMAGTFGASFLPLFWALLAFDRKRVFAFAGLVSAIAITLASASSGPIITLLASFLGLGLWRYRNYTKQLVHLFVLALVGLHFVMEAPVWHLISRVDIVGGSTGYHRYALIDQAIRRFPEWMAVGVRTTGHWGWGLNDVTNQFVLQAVRAGFLGLVSYILLIRSAFRAGSRAMEMAQGDEKIQKLCWAWNSVLFAHVVSFFGVSYFGQMDFFLYLTYAVIASLPTVVSQDETTHLPLSALHKGQYA